MKARSSLVVCATVVALVGGIVWATPGRPLHAQGAKNVWEGVYSDAQAGRGKKAYIVHCASCHNEGLQGGDLAPALKGEDFLLRWDDKSMFEFFDRVQKTMPQDNPGAVSAQDNADIIAYILQVNRMPASAADLSSDAAALEGITITKSKS
jgi:mono/diheme cytochrome c family protein